MDIYNIEKPNLSDIDSSGIFKQFTDNTSKFIEAIEKVNEPIYLYWDKIKYKNPVQTCKPEEFWYLAKQIRAATARKTIIKANKETYFKWIRLNYTDEFLHKIDIQLGGQIFTHYSNLITPNSKQRLLTKSIMEEAIASSQLEGASTTTPIAKKMLLENRPPRDRSEQMIVNNYKTMRALDEEYKNKKLSEEMLFEIHKLITKDTLTPDKQGRYRTNEDGIVVSDEIKYIYYVPPKEDFVKEQIKEFIKFANDENEDTFVHPIIKAIFLHFWIGYLHPFYDGNGRLARTIFYWYLLKKRYWAIAYIPISLVIKESSTQYGMAYVYSEQDDFDLTYFYDYHMRKIMLALEDFNIYVEKKIGENNQDEKILFSNIILNERQKEVLHYLMVRDGAAYTTPSIHQNLYNISRTTAIADLKDLEKKELIKGKKDGIYVKYYATDKLTHQN
ncbi:MAG: Fic family protein [Candidatus Levyibacteriota bacterium]